MAEPTANDVWHHCTILCRECGGDYVMWQDAVNDVDAPKVRAYGALAMNAFWIAIAAPSLLVVSLFSDFLKRYSVNEEQRYCAVERRRTIQWGVHAGRPYLFIELPSWDWHADVLRDEFCWHRRVIVWIDGLGWRLWYRPEYQKEGG